MKTSKDVDKFNLVSLKELKDIVSKMPKPVQIWRGLNEGNFGYIYGPSKAGKSTFAENLAISLAIGKKSFWGYKLYKGNPIKVLFINFEENCLPRMLRAENQLKPLSKQEKSVVYKNLIVPDCNFLNSLSTKKDWEKLEEIIKKSEAKIVFVDSITRLYSGSIENSEESQKLTLNLRDLQSKLDITLICIHHTTKSLGIISQDSLAGSRVITQEADFAIGINKTKQNQLYLKEVFYRYAGIDNDKVELFTIDGNQWLIVQEKVNEFDLFKSPDFRVDNSNGAMLIEYIKKTFAKTKFSTGDLMKVFVNTKAISKPTLQKLIKELVEQNLLTRHKRGEYSLNKEGKEARND